MRFSVRRMYAAFFIGVSVIPIIFTAIFWFLLVGSTARGDAVKIAQFNMGRFESYMNHQINELVRASLHMSGNRFLRPGEIQLVSDEQQLISELGKYKDRIAITDDVLMYSKNKNALYTKSYKFDLDIYFNYVIKLPGYADMLDEMLSLNKFAVDMWGDYIAVIFPLSAWNTSYDGMAAIFLLSTRAIVSSAREFLNMDGMEYHIAHEGVSLFSSLDGFDAGFLFDTVSGAVNEAAIAGDASVVFTSNLSSHGFQYAASIPESLFWQDINALNRNFILVTGVASALSVTVAILFIYASIKPIKKIENSLAPMLDSLSKNELNNIQTAVDQTIKSNMLLKTQMFEQRVLLIDNLFSIILKTEPDDELIKRINALGIPTNCPFYAITIFESYWANKTGDYKAIKFFESLNTEPPTPELLYASWQSEEKHAVVLWGFVEDSKKTLADNYAATMKKASDSGVMGVMLASRVTDSIKKLHFLYIEAILAGKMEENKRFGDVVFYDASLSNGDGKPLYPARQILLLSESIKQGNEALALEALDEIAAMYQKGEGSLFFEYCISADIIKNIINSASEAGAHAGAGIKEFSIHTNINELCGILKATVADLCRQVVSLRTFNKNKRVQEILDYVAQNFYRNDLSLEMLADIHSVSVSHLSNLFKRSVGVGFKDYCVMLRMEKAKTLLKDAGMNIGDISESVGYVNPSHFIKIFKDYEGVTPKAYRSRL